MSNYLQRCKGMKKIACLKDLFDELFGVGQESQGVSLNDRRAKGSPWMTEVVLKVPFTWLYSLSTDPPWGLRWAHPEPADFGTRKELGFGSAPLTSPVSWDPHLPEGSLHMREWVGTRHPPEPGLNSPLSLLLTFCDKSSPMAKLGQWGRERTPPSSRA